MAKKGITIGKARSALYKSAKVLGDVNAVKNGRIGARIANRAVGKVTGRLGGKLAKSVQKLFS